MPTQKTYTQLEVNSLLSHKTESLLKALEEEKKNVPMIFGDKTVKPFNFEKDKRWDSALEKAKEVVKKELQ